MGVVVRTQVELTGWVGAPGLMTFHWVANGDDVPSGIVANDFTAQLRSMFDDLKAYLAVGVTVRIPEEHRCIDTDTGNLVTVVSTNPVAPVASSDTGSATSRATMAKFQYTTDGIRGNRFVRGGPFFGPISDGAMTTQGAMAPAFLAAVPSAHEGLLDVVGDGRLVIYSVPFEGDADNDPRPGMRSFVQSASAWSTPAVLRSRRD